MAKWSHYIGGKYTEASFIEEALEQGISRRVSAQQAQKMHYGDVVACLSWRNGRPVVFAEFAVSQLFLPDDVSTVLTAQLDEEGCISEASEGGGGAVNKKCGSYMESCTHTVSGIDIPEIVARANVFFAERSEKPWYMIGGQLGKAIMPPMGAPSTPFFRGFRKATGYAHIMIAHKHKPDDPNIVGVIGYQRG